MNLLILNQLWPRKAKPAYCEREIKGLGPEKPINFSGGDDADGSADGWRAEGQTEQRKVLVEEDQLVEAINITTA